MNGAQAYVNGFGHSAFRFVLPYFISAFKAGNANVQLPTEGAVAWYRTTPASVCGDGGEQQPCLYKDGAGSWANLG